LRSCRVGKVCIGLTRRCHDGWKASKGYAGAAHVCSGAICEASVANTQTDFDSAIWRFD
jgi:hypothetical protein